MGQIPIPEFFRKRFSNIDELPKNSYKAIFGEIKYKKNINTASLCKSYSSESYLSKSDIKELNDKVKINMKNIPIKVSGNCFTKLLSPFFLDSASNFHKLKLPKNNTIMLSKKTSKIKQMLKPNLNIQFQNIKNSKNVNTNNIEKLLKFGPIKSKFNLCKLLNKHHKRALSDTCKDNKVKNHFIKIRKSTYNSKRNYKENSILFIY